MPSDASCASQASFCSGDSAAKRYFKTSVNSFPDRFFKLVVNAEGRCKIDVGTSPEVDGSVSEAGVGGRSRKTDLSGSSTAVFGTSDECFL